MNYADIIWKQVERLLDEKHNEELADDRNTKEQTED